MKTQLLEDIGESAGSSLTPSNTAGNPQAGKAAPGPAPAGNAAAAGPRPPLGVWRREPPVEPPPVSPTQQPDPPSAPVDLNDVLEEIAALEAQYVQPGAQHAPAAAPDEPRLALADPPYDPRQPLADPPAGPRKRPAVPPAAPALDPEPDPALTATAPQEPLFDFTPPLPGQQPADPFVHAPAAPVRSRGRYLVWAACALSGALVLLGGRWLYQEHKDAGSLALIAGEANNAPRADRPLTGQALAAQETAPGAGAALPGPARPSLPAPSSPPPPPPPLVMLEPDPPAAAKAAQPPAPELDRAAPGEAPKPLAAARKESASPAPKPSSRAAREQSMAAAEPARAKRERAPVRQLARAPAARTAEPGGQDASMAATLKACREQGYHATQCVKLGCSATQYGLVCRGR